MYVRHVSPIYIITPSRWSGARFVERTEMGPDLVRYLVYMM